MRPRPSQDRPGDVDFHPASDCDKARSGDLHAARNRDGRWLDQWFKVVAAKIQPGSSIVLWRHKRYDDEAVRQAPIIEQPGMEIKAPACSSFNPQIHSWK
jgi:hypothetical protein